MTKEEIREYIIAKRTPISHCIDLTKYFIGRHKTLPIFLTPAFEMEFNRSMQELEILSEQVKKQKEVIDKIMNLIKKYGKYDGKKCTRGFQMWSADFNKILDILKEVSE